MEDSNACRALLEILKEGQNHERRESLQKAFDDGFMPKWYLPQTNKDAAANKRIIVAPRLLDSKRYEAFHKLIEGNQRYGDPLL